MNRYHLFLFLAIVSVLSVFMYSLYVIVVIPGFPPESAGLGLFGIMIPFMFLFSLFPYHKLKEAKE